MNFNAPICPLLHLFLSPLPLPSFHPPLLHLHLHPFFPEGRIKRWGSCVCVCRMCECKVVVYGEGGCISHFPAVPLSHTTAPPLLLNPYTSPSPHLMLLSSSVLLLVPLSLPSPLHTGFHSGERRQTKLTHTHTAIVTHRDRGCPILLVYTHLNNHRRTHQK